MTQDEKPQFLKLLSVLFGAYGKPLSESMASGYWKGLEKMPLASFERCCDEAIEKLQYAERGVCKTPTVSELWDLKRGLMGRIRPAEKEPEFTGDHWDIAANHLLLNHISQNAHKRDPIDYAPDLAGDVRVSPGPHTVEIAKILRKYAKQWASARRADEADGVKEGGREDWLAYMSQADADVVRYLAVRKAA